MIQIKGFDKGEKGFLIRGLKKIIFVDGRFDDFTLKISFTIHHVRLVRKTAVYYCIKVVDVVV